jgi:hypothetical protein
MKRSLALLALVLVLMAGTAGMASALTLTFEVGSPELSPGQLPMYPYIPPSGSPIASVTYVNWENDGGGHLYCNNVLKDNIINFTTPTYVNNFQMTGLPWQSFDQGEETFAPLQITAFNATGGPVWTTTVDFLSGGDTPYSDPEVCSIGFVYLTVPVNTADVSKIIFYGSNPSFPAPGNNFVPSIDNLVINEAAAVPIPPSVWLLASGLLALVGLRKKLSFK